MENVRLIHSVDKISNLKTLVKQDLRELGIKVPKSKKTKKLNQSRNTSQDGLLTASIFGNYLSFVPGSYIADCGFVPKFLVDAAEIIEEHCHVEGIFRKSGSINRQKELRQQIEDGQDLKAASASVHDVTALIKQFFRELPEPLLTSVFHDCFVRCYHLASPDQVEAMLLLCLLLPPDHLSTLRFTMGFLSRLAEQSVHNKMDEGNLAVVLAPNIMHVNSRSQKMNSTEEKLLQLQTAIVELLIRNADRLGIVSESLSQRTSLMTECFGTEDELDASDDNTLEDSKDAKEVQKKRRKRSSSLQGLVSSIGRGIAKLRRSTDGKSNLTSTSQMSLSNEGGLASQSQSQSQSSSKAQEMSLPPSAPSATPVVMRKRKASADGVPFSATKKKAILENLPHKTALGVTPFTPASARRPGPYDPRHQNGLETPSIAFTGKSQMNFSATPSHDVKTPARKKLGLFSPSSSRKSKRRKSSTTNLCTNPLRKSGKAKHLFKRMSGGRDKDFHKDGGVGERLASPTGVSHSESATELDNATGHSPMAGLLRSASSPSLHNVSIISTISVPNTLNQGFIDPDETMDLDSTRFTLASLVPSSLSAASLQERGRTMSRQDSFHPGQRPVQRSHSTDGPLRRGQPNTIGNGLLEGKTEKLFKLRRSFDKSDISFPIPIIVPTLPDKVPLDRSMKSRSSEEISIPSSFMPLATCGHRYNTSGNTENGRISRKGSEESIAEESAKDESPMESSLLNVVLPPPTGFNDQSMDLGDGEGGSDTESDAGFSTISGGTVIHNPPAKTSTLQSLQVDFRSGPRNMAYYGSSVSVNVLQPSLQTSTSVDSLLSSASETSVASSASGGKVLERTFSVDSGKGSLVENETSVNQVNRREKERQLNTTFTKSSPTRSTGVSDTFARSVDVSSGRSIKSISAEDLKSKARVERPTARSNSMYVASSSRHANMVPNLQISAETHKLLTRAGFLTDSDLPHNVRDVSLPPRSPQKLANRTLQTSCGEQKSMSFRHKRPSVSRDNVSRESLRTRTDRKHDIMEGDETAEDRIERGKHDPEQKDQDEEPFSSWIMDRASLFRQIETGGHNAQVGVGNNDPELMEDDAPQVYEARSGSDHNSHSRSQTRTPQQPTLSLKRAEVRMQKHESVLDIKESNIGRVAANIQQINSSLERSTLDQSDASLHFSKCTTRKRGVSPIRIPTIFANTDKKAEYYRSLAQKACRKMEDQSFADTDVDSSKLIESAGRERMQKSHRTKHNDRHLQVPKESKKFAFESCAPDLAKSNRHVEESRSIGQTEESRIYENLKIEPGMVAFNGQESELSSSLLETIEDVLTPRKEGRRSHKTSRSPLHEATNTNTSLEGKLRTSKGLTPHQVLRYGPVNGGSNRSPAKPVKRLQSPRSPHGRHSPHKFAISPEKSSQEPLRLASHPNQTLEQY